MKRTTYIILGILVSGLLLIVFGIFLLFLSGEPGGLDYRNGFSIDGKKVETELKGIHVIELSVTQINGEKPLIINGELIVNSSAAADQTKFSYPEHKYLSVNQKADTLVVSLNIDLNTVPEKQRGSDLLYINQLPLNLSIDSGVTCIINNIVGLSVQVKDLKSDSLSVRSSYDMKVLSCQFRSLDVAVAVGRLDLEVLNTEIRNFYLDLDNVNRWTFEKSKVGIEYLTGSGRHNNNIQKGECQKMVWTPKNREAEMEVTLHEKSEVTLMPDIAEVEKGE